MKISNYFKFIIPSVLFYLLMKIFFTSGISSFSINTVLVLFIVSSLSAFWITKYRYLPILLTFLFSSSSVIFLVTLGEKNIQYLYMAISSLLFMLSLVGLNRFFSEKESGESEEKRVKILDSGFNLNQSIVMISVFLFSSGIYGIYIDSGLSTWTLLIFIFAEVFFSNLYLAKINFIKSIELNLHLNSARNKTFTFYSFLVALLITELVWAMSFWPANHLTIGAIILISFYAIWNVIRNYLRNKLTRHVIFSNMIFFIIFNLAIIITSKWEQAGGKL